MLEHRPSLFSEAEGRCRPAAGILPDDFIAAALSRIYGQAASITRIRQRLRGARRSRRFQLGISNSAACFALLAPRRCRARTRKIFTNGVRNRFGEMVLSIVFEICTEGVAQWHATPFSAG